MKFKISWPTGIIIALAAFIVFILTFVYMSFMPKYSHDLTSEEYYKDELNYQQEIDKVNKGRELTENVSLTKTANGLLIKFPSEFTPEKINGTIYFQRLSNIKIDFEIPINLTSNEYLIEDEKLVDGRWDVKIEWNVNSTDYLYKEKIIY